MVSAVVVPVAVWADADDDDDDDPGVVNDPLAGTAEEINNRITINLVAFVKSIQYNRSRLMVTRIPRLQLFTWVCICACTYSVVALCTVTVTTRAVTPRAKNGIFTNELNYLPT